MAAVMAEGAVPRYPVHVEAVREEPLSRWLWIVKVVLVLPHVLVLAFLWLAYVVLTLAAFVAILFTGRYPRSIFDFNVGVLRWTWRVQYYAYGALATDRYPPFTLADVPDYPTHLEVDYPEHLSRGLVLVKWWLLAIPHYLIVGLLVGSSFAFGGMWTGGLVGLLVLVAGGLLAVTGRYPPEIYDLVVGLNRWALRVAAYAGLMTDAYPPFRLDTGGHEPGTIRLEKAPPPRAGDGPPPPPAGSGPPPAAPPSRAGGWSGLRITSVVVGAILSLIGVMLLVGAGVSLAADTVARDSSGYVTSGTHDATTSSYALVVSDVQLRDEGPVWLHGTRLIGTVRVRVTAADGSALFVGLAPSSRVDGYLGGVARAEVTDFMGHHVATTRELSGVAPAQPPAAAGIWTETSVGTGTRELRWDPQEGDWSLVVMRPDGTAALDVRADVGARLPALGWLSLGLFVGSAVVGTAGVAFVVLAVRRAGRASAARSAGATA